MFFFGNVGLCNLRSLGSQDSSNLLTNHRSWLVSTLSPWCVLIFYTSRVHWFSWAWPKSVWNQTFSIISNDHQKTLRAPALTLLNFNRFSQKGFSGGNWTAAGLPNEIRGHTYAAHGCSTVHTLHFNFARAHREIKFELISQIDY